MGIIDLLHRATKTLAPKETQNKPMSPAERELNSYLERERQDHIKRRLAEFRKKNAQEVIFGTPMESKTTILQKPKAKHNLNTQKNTIAKQKTTVLGNSNLLKQKNILKSKRGLI